jgi:hypothetical protein
VAEFGRCLNGFASYLHKYIAALQQIGVCNVVLVGGLWAMETMMHPDEYCRLYAACLVMARQPDLPDVQARWLVMAQASLDLATVVDKKRRRSPYEIPLRLN